jgi:hypothetical protein
MNPDKNDPLYYDEEAMYFKRTFGSVGISSFRFADENLTIPRIQVNSIGPGDTDVWYIWGPENQPWVFDLAFIGGGGHYHGQETSDSRAAGTINPSSGWFGAGYPQDIPCIYRGGEVCGNVRLRLRSGSQVEVVYETIVQAYLQPLAASTGVVLVGSTATHTSNHWGTSGLCDAIARLGRAYHERFGSPIYVNDMSLVNGGLFDLNGNFSTPHITHRDGRNVDMNWSSMNLIQRTWFRSKAEEIGFIVEVHENPRHWHLRFG